MTDKQKIAELEKRLAEIERKEREAAELKRWRIERSLGLCR